MDFEQIRWKLADDMSPQEVELIVSNQDKLNDEEKAAFAGLISAAQPLSGPDDILNDTINAAVENEIDNANNNPENTEQQNAAPAVAPVVPATPAQPVIPTVPQTQEQLDAYLEQKRKGWETEGKTKQEQTVEETKIQQFFDAGYTPKDWNEYTNDMFNKIAPAVEQRIIARLQEENRKFAEQQTQLKATQKEVYDKFEGEFATLAQSKLIPDPATQKEEYDKVHNQILAIGDAHNKTNVTEAYKLWSIIPVIHGGGLVVSETPAAKPDTKAAMERQKAAAAKIQPGRGAPGSRKGGPPQWAHVHNANIDDLIEAAQQNYMPS